MCATNQQNKAKHKYADIDQMNCFISVDSEFGPKFRLFLMCLICFLFGKIITTTIFFVCFILHIPLLYSNFGSNFRIWWLSIDSSDRVPYFVCSASISHHHRHHQLRLIVKIQWNGNIFISFKFELMMKRQIQFLFSFFAVFGLDFSHEWWLKLKSLFFLVLGIVWFKESDSNECRTIQNQLNYCSKDTYMCVQHGNTVRSGIKLTHTQNI